MADARKSITLVTYIALLISHILYIHGVHGEENLLDQSNNISCGQDICLLSDRDFTQGDNYCFIATNEGDTLDQDSIKNVSCTSDTCFFPGNNFAPGDIKVKGTVTWEDNHNLVLHAKGNIIFTKGAKLIGRSNSSISIKPGMEPGDRNTEDYTGTIIFENPSIPNEREKGVQIEMERDGLVKIYYNPVKEEQPHRFMNRGATDIREHIKAKQGTDVELYVLINDIYDLQNIGIHLYGNYALSQDIDATVTKTWYDGKGFEPLQGNGNFPFSGNFDGNNYSIKNLFINRSGEDDVGLFGKCGRFEHAHNIVENLTLENFDITGDHYVGSLVGFAAHTDLRNITLINSKVRGRDVVGGFVGTADRIQAKDLQMVGIIEVSAKENKSFLVGSARNSNFSLLFDTLRHPNYTAHNVLDEKNYLARLVDEGNSLDLLLKTEKITNIVPLKCFLSSILIINCTEKESNEKI